MKQVFKYIISVILLILFTIVIVMFPKIYFKKYDNNDKNNFKINLLNLTNIYKNNSLSNDEILRLLNNYYISYDDVKFVIETDINEKEYLDIMQDIKLELSKINLDCYQVFINNFNLNFENIEINAKKIYLTNSKKESAVLISLACFSHIDNKNFYVVLDNNKHTLFSMQALNNLDDSYTTNMIDDYIKYLGVSKANVEVQALFSEREIYFSPHYIPFEFLDR